MSGARGQTAQGVGVIRRKADREDYEEARKRGIRYPAPVPSHARYSIQMMYYLTDKQYLEGKLLETLVLFDQERQRRYHCVRYWYHPYVSLRCL